MIYLRGRKGGTTHLAVALLASLPSELRLIGGLAVMCRVGMPHRATVDLDAVTRGLAELHEQIARLAVSAPGGGQYTFADKFDLDVIDVSPDASSVLIETLIAHPDPLDDLELNVIAHTWAFETATPLDIVAIEEKTSDELARAEGRLVASPVGLIAMKATTIPLRSSSRPEKRASDFYDLGRLLVVGGVHADAFSELPEVLRTPIIARLTHWFVDDSGRDRTFREVRRFDEPRLDLDEVADAVEDLVAAVSR